MSETVTPVLLVDDDGHQLRCRLGAAQIATLIHCTDGGCLDVTEALAARDDTLDPAVCYVVHVKELPA